MVTNRYNKSTVKILKNLLKSLLNTFFGRDLSKHEVPVYEYNAILKRDVRVNIELRTDFNFNVGCKFVLLGPVVRKVDTNNRTGSTTNCETS